MTRDFTEKQMRAACARNRFEPWGFGLWDLTKRFADGRPRASYGWRMVKRRDGWKIHYRASIAHAIAERKRATQWESEQ